MQKKKELPCQWTAVKTDNLDKSCHVSCVYQHNYTTTSSANVRGSLWAEFYTSTRLVTQARLRKPL